MYSKSFEMNSSSIYCHTCWKWEYKFIATKALKSTIFPCHRKWLTIQTILYKVIILDIYTRQAVKMTGTIFWLSQVFLLGCGIRLQCNLLGREQFLEVTTNFQISYNPGANKQTGNRNTKEIQLKCTWNAIEIPKKYNWNTIEI